MKLFNVYVIEDTEIYIEVVAAETAIEAENRVRNMDCWDCINSCTVEEISGVDGFDVTLKLSSDINYNEDNIKAIIRHKGKFILAALLIMIISFVGLYVTCYLELFSINPIIFLVIFTVGASLISSGVTSILELEHTLSKE